MYSDQFRDDSILPTWYRVSEFMAGTEVRTCVDCGKPEREDEIVRDADDREGGAQNFMMHMRCQPEKDGADL